jgi:hypothetical protein
MILSSVYGGTHSVNPERIVTPSLDLFDSKNKTLPNGDVIVQVTTFNEKGDFIHRGSRQTISKAQYDRFMDLTGPVYEMVPDSRKLTDHETRSRRGTAFHIGENLVLTNFHVLDPTFTNKNTCADFMLKDHEERLHKCKKVHFCDPVSDVCLIEMAPRKKGGCLFCEDGKKMISLADGPRLKLKSNFEPHYDEQQNLIGTAIGNSGAYGIHLSQGRGMILAKDHDIYFYAPVTGGNSGGPLLDAQGLVVGVVKEESQTPIGSNPNLVCNMATRIKHAIALIRESLKDDPETLIKFNRSVVE